MRNSNEIKGELRAVAAELEAIDKAVSSEKRKWGADDDAKWGKATDRVAELKSELKRVEEFESLNKVKAENREAYEEAEDKATSDEKRGKVDYSTVFNKYVRFGKGGLTREERSILKSGYVANSDTQLRGAEQRNQVTTTNSLGGYLVDTVFDNTLIKALESRNAFLAEADVIRTSSGQTMLMPTFDGTAVTGQRVGEAASSTKVNMTFGQKSVGAHKYGSGLIGISTELVEDMEYNVIGDIQMEASDRIGDITNSDMTIGHAGSTHIGASNAGLVQSVTASGVEVAVNTFTYDKLVDLTRSVDRAYRGNAKFCFTDTTEALLMKMKDSQNRPIWMPSTREGAPDRILGFQYFINDYMPEADTNDNICMLFGDFSKYRIRIARGITLKQSTERYFEDDLTVYLALMRVDAVLRDPRAIKSLAVVSA